MFEAIFNGKVNKMLGGAIGAAVIGAGATVGLDLGACQEAIGAWGMAGVAALIGLVGGGAGAFIAPKNKP